MKQQSFFGALADIDGILASDGRDIAAALGTSQRTRVYFLERVQEPSQLLDTADGDLWSMPYLLVAVERMAGEGLADEDQLLALLERANVDMSLLLLSPRCAEALRRIAIEKLQPLVTVFVAELRESRGTRSELHLPDSLAGLVVRLLERVQTQQIGYELWSECMAMEADADHYSLRKLVSAYRLSSWSVRRFLEFTLPTLRSTAGDQALADLCGQLAPSLGGPEKQPEDYSYLWLESLDPAALTDYASIRELLASAIVGLAVSNAKDSGSKVRQVVAWLNSLNWHFFRRVALHVTCEYNQRDVAEVQIADKEMFANPAEFPEYHRLLTQFFERAEPATQITYFGLVAAGAREMRDRCAVALIDDAAAHEWRERWLFERLQPVRNSLTAEWQAIYADIQRRRRFEPHPARSGKARTATWVGPQPPLTQAEFNAMPSVEAWTYVSEFVEIPSELHEPVYALASLLRGRVAGEPRAWVVHFGEYPGLYTALHRAILDGLSDARCRHDDFPYEEVLAALSSRSPWQPVGKATASNRIPDDTSVVSEAIGLLEGCLDLNDNQPSGAPVEYAELVADAIGSLDSWVDQERTSGDHNVTPRRGYELAINRAPGQYTNLLVRQGLWLHVAEGLDDASTHLAAQKMQVFGSLKRIFTPRSDWRVDERAMLGKWLPWLALVNQDWVRQNRELFFPTRSEFREIRDYTWACYLALSAPWDKVFDLLRGEYERAVAALGQLQTEVLVADSTGTDLEDDPTARLGFHLASYALRGKIELSPTSLFGRFAAHAPKYALAQIANDLDRLTLRTDQEGVTPERKERLPKIWSLLSSGGRTNKQQHPVLREFGWWVEADVLPWSWVRGELDRLARGKVVPHRFAEVLRVVEAHRSEVEAWRLVRWLEEFFLLGKQGRTTELAWAADMRKDTVACLIEEAVQRGSGWVCADATRVADGIAEKYYLLGLRPVWRKATESRDGWVSLPTWGGRSSFVCRRTPGEGVTIKYGRDRANTFEFTEGSWTRMLQELRGEELSLGAIRQVENRPQGSLDRWIGDHVTKTSLASYVASILEAEGCARRTAGGGLLIDE